MLMSLLSAFDFLLRWIVGKIDAHTGMVAFLGVFIGYLLYLHGRRDHKKDAAKLIYQEMRYAEAKIIAYRIHHTYTFTEKVLPTNNWHNNIGLFVNDLDTTELDRISRFYSNAAYLDDVIRASSDKYIQDSLNPSPEAPSDAIRIETSATGPAANIIEAISAVIEGTTQTTAGQKLHQISTKKWFKII